MAVGTVSVRPRLVRPGPRRRGLWSAPAVLGLGLLAACGGLEEAPRLEAGLRLEPQMVTVVATGLDNPRGVEVAPNGAVLVAEAGLGGDDCFVVVIPDFGEEEVCTGPTGAITRVRDGVATRIVEGLPSIAALDGTEVGGPHDVGVLGDGTTFATIGLGPFDRALLGPGGALAGHLVRVRASQGSVVPVADLFAYEEANDPDGAGVDSNPYGVASVPGARIVADAGGNSLLRVDATGVVSTLAVFPDVLVDAPPFLGLPPGTQIPMQAVPTGVARGPDGAYYVGQLTGFPFPVGAAQVFRVVPGQAPTVHAAGFTNIIDVAFGPDGSLYVLEIATHSLLSGDPTGALHRVRPDGTVELLLTEPLVFPGGLAVGEDGALYVSNCAVCPGAGVPGLGAGALLHVPPPP